MNTLVVFRFDGPDAAEAALPRLRELVDQRDAGVGDAALVSWPPDHIKPSTQELGCLDGPGALWGGFWGLLLGLIFLTPIAGPAFGAAAGAVAGSLSDFGVDDDFIKDVREIVTPGTSAIFVVSIQTSADRLTEGLPGVSGTLRSNLSPEQELRLIHALGAEST